MTSGKWVRGRLYCCIQTALWAPLCSALVSFALLCPALALLFSSLWTVPLLCSGLLLLLKMTNIWPHMLRALPPTIGRHNRAYDAYDHAAHDAHENKDDCEDYYEG